MAHYVVMVRVATVHVKISPGVVQAGARGLAQPQGYNTETT